MLSRSYNKRIEIWKSTAVEDGFGGWITSEAKIYKQWAYVKTKTSVYNTDVGKILNVQYLEITMRKRIDYSLTINDHYIVYNCNKYVIDSIENYDLNDLDIVLKCSQHNA